MSEHIHDRMTDYLAGELSSSDRNSFERHIASCRECAAELETARAFWSRLERSFQTGFPERLPADARTRFESEIEVVRTACREEKEWRRRVWRKLYVQIAAVLVVGGLLCVLVFLPSDDRMEPRKVSGAVTHEVSSSVAGKIVAAPARVAAAAPMEIVNAPAKAVRSMERRDKAEDEGRAVAAASILHKSAESAESLEEEADADTAARSGEEVVESASLMPGAVNAALLKALGADRVSIDFVKTGVPDVPKGNSPFSLRVQSVRSPFASDMWYVFVSVVPNPQIASSLDFSLGGLPGEKTEDASKPFLVGTYPSGSPIRVYGVAADSPVLRLAVRLPEWERPVSIPVRVPMFEVKRFADAYPALRMAALVSAAGNPQIVLRRVTRRTLDGEIFMLLKSGYDRDSAAMEFHSRIQRVK